MILKVICKIIYLLYKISYLNMSRNVLIYSCNTITQIGLSYCVKRSITNTSVFRTNSLEQIFTEESNFELFIIDISHSTEMYYINAQLAPHLRGRKIVFFVENIENDSFLRLKEISYIHKDNSELEIVKHLRRLCNKGNDVIKYKSVSKQIQNKNKLSKREKECANLLMRGYSVTQISNELSLGMSTISTYKKRIQKKTNSNNVIQLIKTLNKLREM